MLLARAVRGVAYVAHREAVSEEVTLDLGAVAEAEGGGRGQGLVADGGRSLEGDQREVDVGHRAGDDCGAAVREVDGALRERGALSLGQAVRRIACLFNRVPKRLGARGAHDAYQTLTIPKIALPPDLAESLRG